MKSVSIICGSKPRDGIYQTGLPLYNALVAGGLDVTWYQCSDQVDTGKLPEEFKVIKGVHAFGRTLSMGINRLFIFPRKLKSVNKETLFLLDPTLLRVAGKSNLAVVKVHDLRAITAHSDKLSTKLMFRYVIPRLKNSRAIIVGTEYMKSELVRIGLNASKIFVISEMASVKGSGANHIKKSTSRIKNDRILNLLYVATDRPYKNIPFFVDIAKELIGSCDSMEYNFHLVSRLKKSSLELTSKLPSAHFKTYTDVADLAPVYEEADILLFPSKYEGFGLPIVESLSFGLPVISNDIPTSREILGKKGILLGVEDIANWKNSIERLSDAENYLAAANESLDRSNAFSQEAYTNKVISVFNNL